MDEQFKPGDVVQLNSSGPDMTVISIREKVVECVWYQGGHQGYVTHSFVPETLRKVG